MTKLKDQEKQVPSTSNISISDELLKLADLKEKGILNEEEFQMQKKKLLNN